MATSSAAAVGVGARTSATKSAIVKSVSWPTPQTTGTGLRTMARASASSLKAQRSSMEPPPRTRRITSMRGAPPSCTPAAASLAKVYRRPSARTSSAGAPAPWTGATATTTGTWGARRCNVLTTSCSAAAPSDVTSPMPRGIRGNARLRAASNRPSLSSRAFNRRNCSNRAPAPACRMDSTINCKSPRGS